MTEQTRYPLSWPTGWKRTPSAERQRASFGKSRRDQVADKMVVTTQRINVPDAIVRLSAELQRLGATSELLSTNLQTRLDGYPRGGQSEPFDTGVACYFKLNGKPQVLACDRWNRVADNIAAIAQHIDALRRIERYGVGTMEQAFAGYAALPASPTDWWLVLEVGADATDDDIDAAYRRLARAQHPDVGGSHDAMARLNTARDIAKARNK